jgi:hypothetical protein
MATQLDHFTIHFAEGFDDQQEFEMPSKGYVRDVVVRLENGSEFKLFFIDPTRLEQDLGVDAECGRPYYSEPNMVVLPEVTLDAIRKAVAGLCRDGFFNSLKPRA